MKPPVVVETLGDLAKVHWPDEGRYALVNVRRLPQLLNPPPPPPAPVAPPPELLSPAEAAALLGVCPKTISRWAAAGRIMAVRTCGGHRRIVRHSLAGVTRLRRPPGVTEPNTPPQILNHG
jgi:excisionase family DNA binding protein